MSVDILASQPQYLQHLAPVWRHDVPRGTFWVTDEPLRRYALTLGIEAVILDRRSRLSTHALTAGIVDYARAKRWGATSLAYMEHGCGQSYAGDKRTARSRSYAGGDGREGCTLLLAPNAYAAARWSERYPAIPVHIIGATRTLPAPLGPGPLLAVSFHWSGTMPEMRNALDHYRSALPRLARDLPVIGTGHPRFTAWSRVYERAGIEYVPDIEEVARRATVYAVDNSSTLWEMGLTRPVIAMNAPWYRREIDHGLRFWSHIPLAVDGPDDLLETAARLVDGGETEAERDRRNAVVRAVIPRLDGAARAATLVAEWAEMGNP